MNTVSCSTMPEQLRTVRLRMDRADRDLCRILDRAAQDLRITETLGPPRFQSMAATDGAVVYAIRLQAEGQPIGAIGYEASQLSYFVDPEHWGTGVASEAVGAICAALRDNGVDRLYASVVRSNVASQRVLERNGFRFDGLEPGGDGGAISSLEAHIRKTPKLRYLARLA